MKCERQSAWSAWVLVLLLLFMGLVSTRAEDQSEPPMPQPSPQWSENSASTGTLQTDPWLYFDQAWISLKLELMGWSEDSQTLYGLLDQLQIEAVGLRSSLTLSREQFEDSEAARTQEREAATKRLAAEKLRADRAEQSAQFWKPVAIGSAVIAVTFLVMTIIAPAGNLPIQ